MARESSLAGTISLAVGLVTLLGVIGGAGVVWGQHDQADKHRDEVLKSIEQRLKDVEKAYIYEHGGDQLPHAKKGADR